MLRGGVLRSFPCAATPFGRAAVRPSLSDDGMFVAYAKDPRTICVANVALGEIVRSWSVECDGLVMSSDATFVVASTSEGLLRLDVETGEGRRTWNGRCGQLLAMTPDARVLVCGLSSDGPLDRGRVMLGSPDHDEPVLAFEHRASVTSLAIAADARTVAVGGADGQLRVWHIDWTLEAAQRSPWSNDALVLSRAFLATHVALADDGLTRRGAPSWDGGELDRFMRLLAWSGLGWLDKQGVQAALERLKR